ncbi:MAG: putative metal-binding motif-containing protein, partial [Proteobacteria bacterium]|nr:putative metal-binding motif-containing protein [Pseudomonadota bacterium]
MHTPVALVRLVRPLSVLLLAGSLAGCSYVGSKTYTEDIQDYDGDGAIAERFGGTDCRDDDPTIQTCDADGDGENSVAAGGTDCDDGDATVGTGAQEICNDIDDDCDGLIDDLDVDVANVDRPTWYRDADGDGFGNPDDTAEACAAPTGFIAVAGDCDDSRDNVNPGANEFCDLVDHNCDGDLEFNAVDMTNYYADGDGDGYGRDEFAGEQGCPGDAPDGTAANNDDCDDNAADVFPGAVETWYDGVDQNCDEADDYDQDGDGATYPDADCDDTDSTIGPGGAELCDGIDNDCDGSIDEVEDVAPFELTYYYIDADGDNAGGGDPIGSCATVIPSGFVATGGDCDDGNPTVNPGGTEVCDGADNDCNGFVDDNASNPNTYYVDGDGDGFGDVAVTACVQADGWSGFDGDCNDGDASIFPGAFEICGDANQQDCDLSGPAFDCDGDGVDGAYAGNGNSGTDCDDTQAATYPNALEICDGADNDCDGSIDNPPTEPVDNLIYYADLDGDGFGAGPQLFPQSCGEAVGMVTNDEDCNDLDAAVHPNAGELCDGIDNNCDTLTDSGLIAEPRAFYLDLDG